MGYVKLRSAPADIHGVVPSGRGHRTTLSPVKLAGVIGENSRATKHADSSASNSACACVCVECILHVCARCMRQAG